MGGEEEGEGGGERERATVSIVYYVSLLNIILHVYREFRCIIGLNFPLARSTYSLYFV